MMTCFSIRNLLNQYIDGQLSEYYADEVDQHLGSCDNCNQEMQDLQHLIGLLGHVPICKAKCDLASVISEEITSQSHGIVLLRKLFFPLSLKVPLYVLVIMGGFYFAGPKQSSLENNLVRTHLDTVADDVGGQIVRWWSEIRDRLPFLTKKEKLGLKTSATVTARPDLKNVENKDIPAVVNPTDIDSRQQENEGVNSQPQEALGKQIGANNEASSQDKPLETLVKQDSSPAIKPIVPAADLSPTTKLVKQDPPPHEPVLQAKLINPEPTVVELLRLSADIDELEIQQVRKNIVEYLGEKVVHPGNKIQLGNKFNENEILFLIPRKKRKDFVAKLFRFLPQKLKRKKDEFKISQPELLAKLKQSSLYSLNLHPKKIELPVPALEADLKTNTEDNTPIRFSNDIDIME